MKAPMRMWMEITNRDFDTLGTTIEVRRYLDSGQPRLSSLLLDQVLPGDIVFHWWRGKDPPSLLGWSVVVGHPSVFEAEEIFVDDFDTEPAPSGEVPFRKPASSGAFRAHVRNTWTEARLYSMYELDTPVTLPMLKRRSREIFTLEQQLQDEGHGGALHFPFVGSVDKGLHGACPRYLARFPPTLLDLLPGRPPTVPELTDLASKTLRVLAVDRLRDPAVQAALEQHAIEAATSLLEHLGYSVIDVSGFRDYQLRAIRDGEPALHVRVIASRAGIEPSATEDEDRAVVVVDRIRLLDDAFPPVTGRRGQGGRLRWWPHGPIRDGHILAPEAEHDVVVEHVTSDR